MEPLHDQKTANRFLEGDTFYPTGHIIFGFASAEAALRIGTSLTAGGVPEDHVTHIPAEEMAREARENLQGVSLFSVGASIPTREKQLQLAEQGVHFLMVYAPEDDDEERVLQRLRGQDVRYAVKYRRLVIENLLGRLASSSPAQEPARVS